MTTRRTVVESSGNVYVSDMPGITPSTDAGLYASLNAAVSAISGTTTTLVLNTNYTLTASTALTIPINICLKIDKGGSITHTTGATLIINGPVDIGRYKVFIGFDAGDVTFGYTTVSEVYPEWWGAVGDDSTNCTIAIQSAIQSLPRQGIVRLSTGIFQISGITVASHGISILGSGVSGDYGGLTTNQGTVLKMIAASTGWAISVNSTTFSSGWGFELGNLCIQGNITAAGGVRVYDADDDDALWNMVNIHDVWIVLFAKLGWSTTLSNSPSAGDDVTLTFADAARAVVADERIFVGAAGEDPEVCTVKTGGTATCVVDYLLSNHTSGQAVLGAIGGVGLYLQHIQESIFSNITFMGCQTGLHVACSGGAQGYSTDSSVFTRIQSYGNPNEPTQISDNGLVLDYSGASSLSADYFYGIKCVGQRYSSIDINGAGAIIYGGWVESSLISTHAIRIRNAGYGCMVLLSDFMMMVPSYPAISVENSKNVEIVRPYWADYPQKSRVIRVDSSCKNIMVRNMSFGPSIGPSYDSITDVSAHWPNDVIDDEGWNTIVEYYGHQSTNVYRHNSFKRPHILPVGVGSQDSLSSMLYGGFDEARTNLISDQTMTGWTTNGTIAVTGSKADPLGGTTAYLVSGTSDAAFVRPALTTVTGTILTFWFMARTDNADGFQVFGMGIYDNTDAAVVIRENFTATTNWELFHVTADITTGNQFLMWIYPGGVGRTDYVGDIVVWKPCLAVINHPAPMMDASEAICAYLHTRRAIASGVVVLTSTSNKVALDASLGNTFTHTVTEATEIQIPTNPTVGQVINFSFLQSGAGAFAITWVATFIKTWSDTGNATGKYSSVQFFYNGTNWIQIGTQRAYA